jgi:hypothetical protein
MKTLYVSAKSVDISPLKPLRLAGFANRVGVYEKLITPIEAQCLLFRQEDREVLLIGADLLWWSADFISRFRPTLAKALGLQEEQILFTASHNHAGPGTGDTFLPLLEESSNEYTAYLEELLFDTCRSLRDYSEEVLLSIHTAQIPYSINRRKLVNGKVLMEPNPEQSITQEAKILTLSRKNALKGGQSDVLAHILHYPCHATSSAENALHSEYPGIIRQMLERQYPGSVTVFLQGATGDIRPNISENGHFIKKDYSETVQFGQAVATILLEALQKDGQNIEPNLRLKNTQITLPLKPKYDKDILKRTDSEDAQWDPVWAKIVSKQEAYDYRLLDLSYLQLCPQWKGLFFNAELVDAYQVYARTLDPNALVVGYTNGMIGYLCTAKQLEDGGYEPDESTYWFALAGPYDASLEKKIKEQIKEQLESDSY